MLATATALPDGRVLVTGGYGGPHDTMLASAELYDPSTGRFSPAAPFYSPRFSHTATLLGDGSVLIAGGGNFTVGYLNSAERYQPATNTWVAAGQMPGARDGQTATLLKDGRVLVAGGFNGQALRSTAIYNPVTNSWSAGASMHTARYHATAVLLADGRVLVVGGEQGFHNLTVLKSAEVYNPADNRWSSAGHLPRPSANETETVLPHGHVLVVGGGDRLPGFTAACEIYNPARNSWKQTAPLPAPRAFHVAAALRDGRVLIAGGINDRGALAQAEAYNPGTGKWSPAGRTTPAYREAAAMLADGHVLVLGGQAYSGSFVNRAELFLP